MKLEPKHRKWINVTQLKQRSSPLMAQHQRRRKTARGSDGQRCIFSCELKLDLSQLSTGVTLTPTSPLCASRENSPAARQTKMFFFFFFIYPPHKRLKTVRLCLSLLSSSPRKVYDSLSLAERKPSFSREEGTEHFARACLVKFSAIACSYKGFQT